MVNVLVRADFHTVFTTHGDAFPSIAPRPRAPELEIKSFVIPSTKATHLRIEVMTNRCTGAPAYAGDQDDDPLNVTGSGREHAGRKRADR